MADRLSIVRTPCAKQSQYSELLNISFDRALALDSKLSDATTIMQGMSGRHYRYFINNLIGRISDARYLEIGSWRGSTACSAMDGNAVKILCIDNWSEFGGPKAEFHHNTAEKITDQINFQFIENDFRKVNFTAVGKYNVYLFDGPHEKQDQFDGLAMALPALDDEFVFIVDDWNFERVRQGTLDAIQATGVEVVSSIEVRTTQDGSMCHCMCELSDWHNGYLLSVLRKKEKAKSPWRTAFQPMVDLVRGRRAPR